MSVPHGPARSPHVSLVTGAGGFVGEHLRRHLTARGDEVRLLSSDPALSTLARLDLLTSSEDEIAAALAGVHALYFCAGVAHEAVADGDHGLMHRVNVEVPVKWLRAADRAGVGQFVWLSSIKVLGDTSSRPLAPNDAYRPGDAYARTKVQAEQRLLDVPLHHARLAVVRPPLVYGPGVRGNFLALLRLADTGLPLPLARATAPRSLVAVDNLCDFLIRLGEGAGGVHHVADGEDISVGALVRTLRRLFNRPARQPSCPRPAIRAFLRLSGRREAYSRLFEPLQVDQAASCRQLDWSPPHNLADALQRTVTWFRTSP